MSINQTLEGPVQGSNDRFSVAERRALIERVAASEPFRRAVRLRDFLLYVGMHSLKDGCPEIHEQEIGAQVFGRSASYDRSQDNIVRVNATELRKRIETYFASDGVHESLILEIPRGGYTPIFPRRLPDAKVHPLPAADEFPLPVPSPLTAAAAGHKAPSRPLVHLVWASVTLLFVIACAVLVQQNLSLRIALHPWQSKPALASFWADFFGDTHQTDIVLSDDSGTVLEEITKRPPTLGEYLGHDYLRQIMASDLSADRKADVNDIFGHNLITYGAVVAAMRIIAIDPTSTTLHLTAARFYGSDALKRDNVILLGGKKANPWLYVFDDQLNFDLESRETGVVVVNRHPKGTEQSVYGESYTSKGPMGYSVIAYLPNPSRTRSAIIIAGTDSDATNAAAEFVTSEEQLQRLRSTLHTDRIPYFEALLRTSQLTGTSFNAEIVAYRTYPGLP